MATASLASTTLDSLPKIKHPYTDYALADAVELAEGHCLMMGLPAPTNLTVVRDHIKAMGGGCDHVWITGLAAMDVLDAAIDGRDLKTDCRLL